MSANIGAKNLTESGSAHITWKRDTSSPHVRHTFYLVTSDMAEPPPQTRINTYLTEQSSFQVNDPHGLFANVTASAFQKNHKLEIVFEVIFRQTMEKSDIAIEVWDLKGNSFTANAYDVWEVVGKSEPVQLAVINKNH